MEGANGVIPCGMSGDFREWQKSWIVLFSERGRRLVGVKADADRRFLKVQDALCGSWTSRSRRTKRSAIGTSA